MKTTTKKLIQFFSLLLIGCFFNFCNAQELDIQTKSNIPSKSEKAVSDLKINFGVNGIKLKATIEKSYPGFKLLGSCMGSVRKEGITDIGLGLYNPVTQQGIYLGALKNSSTYELLEIERFNVPFNNNGILPRNLEVKCNSWTEVLRIAEAFKIVNSETPAASTNLHPKNYFDAICVVPFNSVEEYKCFQYDQKAAKFLNIGGWFND